MQEISLVIGVLALAVSGYAVYMLVQLVKSLDTLSGSVAKATEKLEQIGRQVESQQRDISALQREFAEPEFSGPAAVLPFILKKGGNAQWGTLVALGFKLFTAYWNKRQGNAKSLASTNVLEGDRNGNEPSVVLGNNRGNAKRG